MLPAAARINVLDNETAVLTVTLPATAHESGGSLTGSVISSQAPDKNITVQLASSDTSRLTVPATVTLLAGHTSANFTAALLDDHVIESGTTPVTVTSQVENWTSGARTVNIIDDDQTMTLTLPASGWEGQTLSGAGTIQLGGTLASDLVISLASGDTAELTVPATVTVHAGQLSTTFDVALHSNGLRQGPQTVQVTATTTGLPVPAAIAGMTVKDSDVDHFGFDAISSNKTVGVAFSATARAYDILNNPILVYSGPIPLTASGASGTLSVTPTSATFASGVWTGNVTVSTADTNVALHLNNGAGASATSNTFTVWPKLQVLSTAPAANGVFVLPGPFTYNVTFNEPVTPASVTTSSLVLSGITGATVTGATVLPGNTTVRFTIGGITVEGAFGASIAAGAITDPAGNAGTAFSASYSVDIGTVAFPVPLTPVSPAGSLVYGGSTSGYITPAGDTDSFTVSLDAGQTLTAYVTPALALQAILTVTDPGGNTIGSATAAATGKQVFIQSVPVTTAGTYTLTVGSAAGTGTYTLQIDLNAAIEAESHDGSTNNTFASAQSVDSAFTSLGGGPQQRAAVLGVTEAAQQVFLTWNMDTNPGWTYQGQWAWGQPAGVGGDPNSGHTGANVVGYNLGGQYANSMPVYYATTPALSTLGRTGVQLSFWRWLGVESSTFDHATVQVSRDGSTWTTVWQNSSTISDTAWSLQTIDISAVADNQPQVYIRWGMGPTDSSVTYCGWNIDDVSLSGVGTTNSDYYKFTLAANHTATIGLRSLAAGASVTLDLYDSAGHRLSSGVSSTNLDSVINNFVAPAADTYYICIAGSGSPYSLVVTKDADFDKEPNDTLATAQSIGGAKGVLGYVGSQGVGSGVEPDSYPAGTALTNVVPGITLTTQGDSNTVTPVTSSYTSTGTRVFGDGTSVYFSDTIFLRKFRHAGFVGFDRSGPGRQLRSRFSQGLQLLRHAPARFGGSGSALPRLHHHDNHSVHGRHRLCIGGRPGGPNDPIGPFGGEQRE